MDSDKLYSIKIFPQRNIAKTSLCQLKAALEKVSYLTLCRQYGLDSGLIDQTLQNLEVVLSGEDVSPYFIVHYLPPGGRPIIVYRWDPSSKVGSQILVGALGTISEKILTESLSNCAAIYSVSLHASQLKDIGLLLGYEIARWIGFHGGGLVCDLHGDWYTLNQHQAFIPISRIRRKH